MNIYMIKVPKLDSNANLINHELTITTCNYRDNLDYAEQYAKTIYDFETKSWSLSPCNPGSKWIQRHIVRRNSCERRTTFKTTD